MEFGYILLLGLIALIYWLFDVISPIVYRHIGAKQLVQSFTNVKKDPNKSDVGVEISHKPLCATTGLDQGVF